MITRNLPCQRFDCIDALILLQLASSCACLIVGLAQAQAIFCTTVLTALFVHSQGLKSFEAYQRFPYEVTRLQELEPKLAGGCTAAVAVLAQNFLYVANVGDSRVLVIKEKPNGTLEAQQLSKDDGVENEDELRRLESLGLKPEDLLKAGRLGMQENTRSIGDYYIKEGYRDVDSLRYAWNFCQYC